MQNNWQHFQRRRTGRREGMSEFRHTTQHGAIEGLLQTQEVKYYNLDVIISVGYRVKSRQGTMFRIWATQQLRNYIIRGYALNEVLFKKGNSMNYFRELIEKNSTCTVEKFLMSWPSRKQNRNTRNTRKSRKSKSIWKVLRNWIRTSNN